jgi:uncharacterized protein
MPLALIEIGHSNVELKPSPIEPSWIIDGTPEARSCVLSTSTCGSAWTMIWSCSEGKFNWYYDVDETIMILEGSIVLQAEAMSPTRYGAGDVILFREGAQAKWHVERPVKKLAFFRRTNPLGFNFPIRVVNKLKRISRRGFSS